MPVVYLNRHTSCPLYIGSTPLGFGLIQAETGFRGHFNPHLSTILLVLEGRLRISGPNIGTQVVDKNEMYIVPLGTEHEVTAIEPTRALRLYLIGNKLEFCGRVMNEELILRAKTKRNKPTTLPLLPVVRKFADLMVAYIQDGLLCCDIHQLKQQEFASILQAYYKKIVLSKFLVPLYLTSNSFMEEVLTMAAELLTVDEMAARLDMPRSEFVHLFALHFEEPHGKWLTRNKAGALYKTLRNSSLSLSEIARLLRFSSQQHMNTFCRVHLGCTPRQVIDGFVPDAFAEKEEENVHDEL